jgi:uncharacterized protein DUF3108
MRLLLLGAMLATGLAAEWRSDFPVDPQNLGVSGENPYFVLTPGHTLHFVEGSVRRKMTVLAQTVTIDGVECRVVEDREEKGGKPIEVTRDYYSIDRVTGDVYYFGEDVDVYKRGKVVSHKGSWRSGVKDARFGLMMPGTIKVGDRFMQERAPKQGALDRSEVVSKSERVVTPAGSFDCVRMRDSSAIEKGADDKWYAPGIGLVKDGKAVLVKQGR